MSGDYDETFVPDWLSTPVEEKEEEETTSPALKKRDRSWDEEHKQDRTTYLVGQEVIERIKAIAAEYDRSASYVAKTLLEFALNAYDQGELEWSETPLTEFVLTPRGRQSFRP